MTQTNAALAAALAGNLNETTQSADQSQGGDQKCGCGDDGVQAVGQKAGSKQDADADGNAVQLRPSNHNTPVDIGGGHGKPCRCSGEHAGGRWRRDADNAAAALGIALNANVTDQSVTQSQDGSGVQAAGQQAYNQQDADAEANAVQFKPSNANAPVRIGSGHGERCGCDDGHAGTGGEVAQTNLAAALGIALNANATDQSVEQHQRGGSCKCVRQRRPGRRPGRRGTTRTRTPTAKAIQFGAVERQQPGPVSGARAAAVLCSRPTRRSRSRWPRTSTSPARR